MGLAPDLGLVSVYQISGDPIIDLVIKWSRKCLVTPVQHSLVTVGDCQKGVEHGVGWIGSMDTIKPIEWQCMSFMNAS